jgi:hypothetical protein
MSQVVAVCMMVKMMNRILMILTVYVTVKCVSIGEIKYYRDTEGLGTPPDTEHK